MTRRGQGRALALVAAAVSALAGALPASSRAAVALERIGTFSAPVFVTGPPGDPSRLFVVERAGRIQLLREGRRSTFLDISSSVRTDGERGMLSMAFSPDYASSGRFYVFDTAAHDGALQVEEFRRDAADPDRADPATRRLVISQPHERFSNHNGGQLQFGPDGLLYVGMGDGGGGGDPLRAGQDLGTLLGKIVRIDPRQSGAAPYTVPADNPFVSRAGARPEVWALGLRNPWRFSFDHETGDLVVGDVGQSAWEEIDFAPRSLGGGRGANYGWSLCEGSHAFPATSPPTPCSAQGATNPVFEVPHPQACSVTGGYVVRDPGLPSLRGRYLYGDFCRSELHSLELSTPTASGDRGEGLSVPRLASFGEDACGHVYAASLDGSVFRLVEASPSACAPPIGAPQLPPGLPASGAADTRAPGVVAAISRRQRLRGGAVVVGARCDEPCLISFSGDVVVSGRRRPLRLRSERRAARGDEVVRVRLRASRSAARAIGRALVRGRAVRARAVVRASDAAGNASVPKRRTVRLVR